MHNLTFTVHQFDQWEQILWMYLKVNVVKWETALLVFMQLHMFVMISWINMFYLYDRNNGSETETSLIISWMFASLDMLVSAASVLMLPHK